MANSDLFPSRWGPKQYILAAIAGTLAASAVVIVTSVILSPAHIDFSVTGASSSRSGDGMGVVLNFTLGTDNPSRRAGVQYRAVTVNLRLYSADQRTDLVQATVHESMPFHQPPMSSRSMSVSAFFLNEYLIRNFARQGNRRARSVIVVVMGQMRFKVGLAYSMPYSVVVSCSPVDFFTSGKNASATRVNCVA